MPLIKLNRINKGGEIYLNTEHIRFIEIEGRSTTVNMGPGNVYAVEESPQQISQIVEQMEMARFRSAGQSGGGGQG